MPPSTTRKIKINSGDSLSRIAQREKTTVPELLKLNPNIKNPGMIFAGDDLNLPGQTPIVGTAPSTTTTPSTTTPSPAGQGGSLLSSVVQEKTKGPSERDKILERLTGALSTQQKFDPAARRAELETERGISTKRSNVKSFQEEINKTFTLLDNLESDLKKRTGDFSIMESQRNRILAAESNPLIKSISTLERGLSTAKSDLETDTADIATLISEEEKAAGRDLQSILSETQIRKQVDEIFPGKDVDRLAPIIGAMESGMEDPVEIFNALRAEGIDDVGINDIVTTMKSIKEIRDPDVETQVVDAGGRKILINAKTGSVIRDLGAGTSTSSGGGSGSGPEGRDPVVQSWVNRIASGSAKITNISDKALRNSVVMALDADGVVEFSPTQRNTLDSLDRASTIVDDLEETFGKISGRFANTAGERVTKGIPNIFASKFQTDPDLTNYENFKEGILATLSRATGERGVLTDQDVERARKLIPKITDRKEVAQNKLQELNDLFLEFEQKAMGTFSNTYVRDNSGTVQVKNTGSGGDDVDTFLNSF